MSVAFMAFNRSGRSRVIRVTPSWGWSICTVSTVGPFARLGHILQQTAGSVAPRREQNMGLQYSSIINAPVSEVFAWHERPGALVRLLPPWQPITVAQEASSLVNGRAVLRLPGHLPWVAQHSDDDPPHRFVDELVSLPLHWRHTHSFAAIDGATTKVTDRVETPVPGSFLLQTFRYRHHQLAGDLAAHQRLRHRTDAS